MCFQVLVVSKRQKGRSRVTKSGISAVCHVICSYRLAPEWPYPAAIDDVEQTFRYLVKHAAEYSIHASRIAVAGESVGGNLVAALAIRLRDAALKTPSDQSQPQPKVQILLNPLLQVSLGALKSFKLIFELVQLFERIELWCLRCLSDPTSAFCG